MKSLGCSIVLVAAISLSAVAGPVQSSLTKTGDGVGETISVSLEASGAFQLSYVFLAPSLGADPTLAFLTGDPADTLDIPLTLFLAHGVALSGFTDALGEATFPIPVPSTPSLAGLTLYLQAISIDLTQPKASVGFISEVSNVAAMSLNTPGTFAPSLDSMTIGRALHTATDLGDGRVLVAGGGPVSLANPVGGSATCEIYNMAGETYTTTGSMGNARVFHSATLLQDGRVLVAGGSDEGHPDPGNPGEFYSNVFNSAEVFDPATGAWTPVGSMSSYRVAHTATLLNDGRVLITGGAEGASSGLGTHVIGDILDLLTTATASAEVFDPVTSTFSSVSGMSQNKGAHGAALLPSGNVLIGGGITVTVIFGIPFPSFSTVCQQFNPSTNSFMGTGSMSEGRALFGLTTLNDGRVLATGGIGGSPLNPSAIYSVNIFNSTSWSTLPDLATARGTHADTLLADGRVLVTGGAAGSVVAPVAIAACEIIDPVAGTVVAASSLNTARAIQHNVPLDDGTILIVGGGDSTGLGVNTSETYSP